MKLANQRSN